MNLGDFSQRSLRKMALGGLALVILSLTGIGIPTRPEFETAIETPEPLVFCQSEQCSANYTLIIGNSGKEQQFDVRVRLDRELISKAITPPTVKGSGKVLRRITPILNDTQMVLHTGAIEPGFRVEVQFIMYAAKEDLPSWDDLIIDISPNEGPKVRGSAEVITFGRVLYQLLQL